MRGFRDDLQTAYSIQADDAYTELCEVLNNLILGKAPSDDESRGLFGQIESRFMATNRMEYAIHMVSNNPS